MGIPVAPRFCLPAANPQSVAQREKLFAIAGI